MLTPGLGSNTFFNWYLYSNTQMHVFVLEFVFDHCQQFVSVFVFDSNEGARICI